MECTIRRRGDKTKCPACGWGLDEDAYRCPKCRIYFCYTCRARVGRQEDQYQCADQSCSCYGKLLCSACTVMVSQEGPVTRPTFPIDEGMAWLGFWVGVIIGCIGWYFAGSFWVGLGTAISIWGILVWLAVQTTTTTETLATPRCCIQCRHPIKCL
ncbi:MAG: hypothetical protein FJ271_15090 [Planctomycetes bacterium]|nr:hypothetical protein [Planctomycetota bacterium]